MESSAEDISDSDFDDGLATLDAEPSEDPDEPDDESLDELFDDK